MAVIVLLPIPGEPPRRTSEPGTRPPPRTRSSSPIPVASRSSAGASTSRSGTERGAARGAAARRAAGCGCRRRSDDDLLERVPLRAARALPRPGQRLVAALAADVPAALLRHHSRSCQARGCGRARVADDASRSAGSRATPPSNPRLGLAPSQPERQRDQPEAEDDLGGAVEDALRAGEVVDQVLGAHQHVADDPDGAGGGGPGAESAQPLLRLGPEAGCEQGERRDRERDRDERLGAVDDVDGVVAELARLRQRLAAAQREGSVDHGADADGEQCPDRPAKPA